MLAFQLRAFRITGWTRELQFHPARKWRIDIAFPDHKLAVEVDGLPVDGSKGRHQTRTGVRDDCEKTAALAAYGWRLIRLTRDNLKTGEGIRWIEAALTGEVEGIFDKRAERYARSGKRNQRVRSTRGSR